MQCDALRVVLDLRETDLIQELREENKELEALKKKYDALMKRTAQYGMMSKFLYSKAFSGTDWHDPVDEFLGSGLFAFDLSAYMDMEELKNLYFRFREAAGKDRVRWNRLHYSAAFKVYGLVCRWNDSKVCGICVREEFK